jgi:hypothetical protein
MSTRRILNTDSSYWPDDLMVAFHNKSPFAYGESVLDGSVPTKTPVGNGPTGLADDLPTSVPVDTSSFMNDQHDAVR